MQELRFFIVAPATPDFANRIFFINFAVSESDKHS